MNKRDFFVAACQAEEYRREAWVVSAFSLIQEGPDDWKKNPYPYRIVQTPAGHFFVNPEKIEELLPIEGTNPKEPPFRALEGIILTEKDIPNVKGTVKTVYGNLLVNWMISVGAMSGKIPFQTGQLNPSSLEELILPRLVDDPKEGQTPKTLTAATGLVEEPIYIFEYLRFCDAMFNLPTYMQLFVPAASEKALTAPKGIKEFKAKLLKENEGHLDDPATIARIDKALIDYDTEYLKGDESEGFLSSKARRTVRRKLFLMGGAEAGFGDGLKVDLLTNSLDEGWDVEKFPVMNNTLREGSFNRGYETQLGGESVKWLLRASSNIMVTQKDCGSNLGIRVMLTADNQKKYYGFYVVTPKGPERLDENSIVQYIGKVVMIRSPMFCKLDKTDFCACCVGDRLSVSPTALSSAISDYGSKFLYIFMQKMHGTNLVLAKLNLATAII